MDFEVAEHSRERYDDVLTAVGAKLAERPGPDNDARARWDTAAQIGLAGLCLPENRGGGGLGALDTTRCLEAFGRACPDTGLAFSIAAHLLACGVPLRDFGSLDMQETLLGDVATGRVVLGNAMTEDDAGSDVGRLATTARRDGDVYVLDGTKSFVSNAPLADILLVYASTDPSAGYFGTTAFVVPTALAGMTIGRPLAKLGLRGGTAARVTFAGCRVPAGQRLGDEGAGRVIFQHSMDWERSCLFGIYLGMLDRQLESCVGHVRTRRQFGRRLSDFQAISHQLVQMRQRIEGARLLLYRAAWTLDRNDPDQAAIAMAKISVSEAAVANSTDAVQVFGAIGCLESSEAADQIRDSIPSRIFSGTNEIQRELIARDMGL